MIYRPGEPANGRQKIFIAMAAYQSVGAGCAHAMTFTGAELNKAGIPFALAIYEGNVHVDDSRNRLVHDFLKSDCTDLVFLDADIGWNAPDFVKLVRYDRDVVAGVYPKKHGDDTFPVKTLPGEIWSDSDGLIEVAGVPTGFLRIKRHVLETLAARAEKYNAKNDLAFGTACIFERKIIPANNGTRWGGDYVFCMKWRALGGKIYIDPAMRFEHSGMESWTGNVGQWLRSRSGIGLKSGLDAIRENRAELEHFQDLYDAWGNTFAAAPLILATLAQLAKNAKGPILECGSGISTLVMAAANPDVEVHALEDGPAFADHVAASAKRYGISNISVHCRPLHEDWYDTATLPDHVWALAFIDGPRRSYGRRADAPLHIDLKQTIIVADDISNSAVGAAVIEAFSETHEIAVMESSPQRAFAIGRPKTRTQAEAA